MGALAPPPLNTSMINFKEHVPPKCFSQFCKVICINDVYFDKIVSKKVYLFVYVFI